MHYLMVKPLFSCFRMITAKFSGFRKFRNITVSQFFYVFENFFFFLLCCNALPFEPLHDVETMQLCSFPGITHISEKIFR